MDRKTQLAIALIAAILGINLAITAKFQKQRAAEQKARAAMEAPDSTVPPPPDRATAPSGETRNVPPETREAAAAPAPAEAADATEVGQVGPFRAATGTDGDLVVETPLHHLRIDRSGGVLRELSLRKFEVSGRHTVVDLVPHDDTQPGRRALGLVLQSGGTEWDLTRARFDPSGVDFGPDGRLVLEAGSGPRSFELRCDATGGGAVIERYTIDPDRYDFEVALRLESGPGIPRVDSYQLAWTPGLPVTENNAKEDQSRFRAIVSLDDQILRKRPGDFRKDHEIEQTGTVHWACVASKYFMVGLIPEAPQAGKLEVVGASQDHWIGMKLLQPSPWRSGADAYRIYAGPIAFEPLKELGVGLERAVELGWNWIRPISQLLLHFMEFLNRFIPNYGIIIVIVSVLTRLVFWPLSEKSVRSMRRMQELQPRMEEIRRRYASDPKAMNEQIMLMYREQKVNPLGGCMPMIIQMPIFFALFAVLQSNIELRNAPFFGWIDNLAAPDVIAQLPFSLPVIGNALSILPLLMGGTMIWQSVLTPTPTPSASGGKPNPMAQQQFMMKWVMPIVMTFIFYKMPSGLVVYWITSTLMGILQQINLNRKLGPVPGVVTSTSKSEGRATNGRPDRVDGKERGGSASQRTDRIGRAAR